MILLAAIYEYSKVRKGKKERIVYIDAASHVITKEPQAHEASVTSGRYLG
jgi:hypothetical protein